MSSATFDHFKTSIWKPLKSPLTWIDHGDGIKPKMQHSKIVHRKTKIPLKNFWRLYILARHSISSLFTCFNLFETISFLFSFLFKSTHRTFETTRDVTQIRLDSSIFRNTCEKGASNRDSRFVQSKIIYDVRLLARCSICRWQGMPGIFHNEGWSLFSWSINRLGRLCGGDAAADRVVGKGQRGLCLVLVVCRGGTKREGVGGEEGCKPPRTRANTGCGGGVSERKGLLWRQDDAMPAQPPSPPPRPLRRPTTDIDTAPSIDLSSNEVRAEASEGHRDRFTGVASSEVIGVIYLLRFY